MITVEIEVADHNEAQIIVDVLMEMRKAMVKHPVWPVCNVKRTAIIAEETGEVIREANHLDEGHGNIENLRTEVVQTAGTCIRMLKALRVDAVAKQIENRNNRKGQSVTNIGKTIAYIAHPIGAVMPLNKEAAARQVRMNLEYIAIIASDINHNEPHVVPFVPYYLDCVIMDDDNPVERARGLANDEAILRSGMVNELRLYGTRISAGMQKEVTIAREMGIPVRPMTPETEKEYKILFNK